MRSVPPRGSGRVQVGNEVIEYVPRGLDSVARDGDFDVVKQRLTTGTAADGFEMVRSVGLTLPDVRPGTKYDGSPILKVGGSFMAGLATHPSADPNTLVVRYGLEEREALLEDAPETYYLTDYYQRYPLVLVRLSRIGPEALRDVLSVSWRLTATKVRKRDLSRRHL